MKFVCTQDNLLKGVGAVSPLAGRNPQLPILQHILLEVKDGVLHLTGTDLEVGVHVEVGGKAEEEGRCAVQSRQFLDFVQQLPKTEPINIQLKKRLRVWTGGFQAQFVVSDASDFPLLPTPEGGKGVEFDGRQLCQGLSQVLFAAARDETRPELHSVFVSSDDQELRVAATDSFRLSERVINVAEKSDLSLLLPLGAAQEIVRLFNMVDKVVVVSYKNLMTIEGGGINLSSRLVDGAYPDYHQIIPESFVVEGVVDRAELLRALKVLGVFLARDSKRVLVAVEPSKDLLFLSVEGGETGQGKVEVVFEGSGDSLEAVFNIQYLLDGVQNLVGDKCGVCFSGVSDPITLKSLNEKIKHVYIVMPIQA